MIWHHDECKRTEVTPGLFSGEFAHKRTTEDEIIEDDSAILRDRRDEVNPVCLAVSAFSELTSSYIEHSATVAGSSVAG